jgi:hypothetical protein
MKLALAMQVKIGAAATAVAELSLVATGDDHLGAFNGELASDLETEARGRAGNEG